MSDLLEPSAFLEREARSLLTRVDRLKPFVLQETMVPAALLLPRALVGIEQLLLSERAKLRQIGEAFLTWLRGPGRSAPPGEQQRRYTSLRVRFVTHLAQLDLFSAAITQRSEAELGLWLSGLDVAAADGLRLPGGVLADTPPMICYLDRGPGAAIRRAKTRLPGGASNPVAIIRIPRERMVGHGIASSLMHEVGHQGASLLDLVPSLREDFQRRAKQARGPAERFAWACWAAWVSEIVADFWSVAKLGVGSTLGLVGVVSLPRPFVYRFTLDDPHPFPWIRVIVSASIGEHLYPGPQWAQLRRLWAQLYPESAAPTRVRGVIGQLKPMAAPLAAAIAAHRPAPLEGLSVGEALRSAEREPQRLRSSLQTAMRDRRAGRAMSPTLWLASLGQARIDGRLSPEDESRIVDRLLRFWARQSTLDMARLCTNVRPAPGAQLRRPDAMSA